MRNENCGIERTLFEKIAESSKVGAQKVIFTFGAGHPFDLVKTRMQANPNISSGVLLSKEIFQQTGLRGFYVGGLSNFSRMVLKETYRNPARGLIKSSLQKTMPSNLQSEDFINFFTGISMATTETFIMCPLERIKVWMMTNDKEKKFTGFFNVTTPRHLYTHLFSGLKVTFARNSISWTSYYVAEERIRRKILELSPRTSIEDTAIPMTERFVIGALSGITNLLVTHPWDTAKSVIQKHGSIETKPLISTMKEIVSSYGWKGLYAGWQVRLPHYIIVGIITSQVIQEVDNIWASPKSCQKNS